MAEKFGNSRWFKEGFLDNRTAGLVVGQLTFAAIGSVDICLRGDFKADIAGQIITLLNPQFSDDTVAVYHLGDFAIPQLGTVSMISFDPHPLLEPHPYLEWFSLNQDHYRIELAEGDAWIVDQTHMQEYDIVSQQLRDALASQLESHQTESKASEQEWF